MNILFYDGPCALCHFTVRMIMRLEDKQKEDKLYFASIQSDTAAKLLNETLRTPPLSGVIVIENGGAPKVGVDAVKLLKPYLRSRWGFVTFLVTEKMYRLIAKYRHLSGKVDNASCYISRNYASRILP
jgi:predicted DCC family thiol-disulfide oxidoreductase YuxK